MDKIERDKMIAEKVWELVDHIIELLESNEERYSFDYAIGGVNPSINVTDKKNGDLYNISIELEEKEVK